MQGDMQMESALRESLSSLSKAHQEALTKKLGELSEDVLQVKKKKVDVAQKIRMLIQ